MLALKLGLSLVSSKVGGAADSFLLDEYSGASAAYSLRQLSASTTNVVRVRESVGSTEQDFTSSEITDGTLTTFTGANDGYIVTWYDQSGNGVNVTQATASSQPKLVSIGVVELENGLPCVVFDGSNDYLQAAISIAQPFTLLDVRKYNDTSSQIAISLDTVGTSIADGVLGSVFRSYYGSYLLDAAVNTNQGLWYSLGNGASSSVSLDDAAENIGDAGSSGVSSITIGRLGTGTLVADVKIQEIILYPSDESANKSGISENINSFYSIY